MRRNSKDVTSMVILEGLAWIIVGTALLVGFIRWAV